MSTYYVPGTEPKAPGTLFFFFQGTGPPLSQGKSIPGRPALHKEKRTLPGAPAGFSGIGCVTSLPGTFINSSSQPHSITPDLWSREAPRDRVMASRRKPTAARPQHRPQHRPQGLRLLIQETEGARANSMSHSSSESQ